jgi:hypothetical protein
MPAQTAKHGHELVSSFDVRTREHKPGRNAHGFNHGAAEDYSPRDVRAFFIEPNEICDDVTNSGEQFARRSMRTTLRRQSEVLQ